MGTLLREFRQLFALLGQISGKIQQNKQLRIRKVRKDVQHGWETVQAII